MRYLRDLFTFALLGWAVALSAGEKAQELVPLQLELPAHRPPQESFPVSHEVSMLGELAPPRGETPFMVPAGLRNVALNKPVSSSDQDPLIGEVKQITDGEKEYALNNCVELSPGKVWVQIDLAESRPIYAIVVWHSFKGSRVYYNVVVQVSDDATFSKNVTTLFNNDIRNSSSLGKGSDMLYLESPEGKLIDAKGVKARYVRCYSNGNTSEPSNHYLEVEVWGRPVEGLTEDTPPSKSRMPDDKPIDPDF